MKSSRTAAVLTWIYAAGFGLPAVPVAVYVIQRGTLPWFGDLFRMYGGPWWVRFDQRTFLALLGGFAVTTGVASAAAVLVWRGHRRGGPLAPALLPVEAVFWYGFALPIPVAIGAARAALLIAAERARHRPPPGPSHGRS